MPTQSTNPTNPTNPPPSAELGRARRGRVRSSPTPVSSAPGVPPRASDLSAASTTSPRRPRGGEGSERSDRRLHVAEAPPRAVRGRAFRARHGRERPAVPPRRHHLGVRHHLRQLVVLVRHMCIACTDAANTRRKERRKARIERVAFQIF